MKPGTKWNLIGATSALLLALSGVLVACGPSPAAQEVAKEHADAAASHLIKVGGGDYMSVYSWRDPQSGCEYIVVRGGSTSVTMTPRMNASGTQVCK